MAKVNELDDIIREAIKYIDKESEGLKVNINDSRKFNLLLQLILENEEIGLEKFQKKFRVSMETIGRRIAKLLNDIKKEDRPVPIFYESINKIKKELGKKNYKKYTIGFPLNFRFGATALSPPTDKFSSFSVLDYTINNISFKRWQKKFSSTSIEKNKDVKAYQEYLEKIPNKLQDPMVTYWEIDIEAIDASYAANETDKVLEILLGIINFILYHGEVRLFRFLISPWERRLSNIRMPFVYIVLENNNYKTSYFNEDMSERKPVSIITYKRKRFENLLPIIPSLNPKNRIDTILMMAFRSYQQGMTKENIGESFLDFWRCLETLTLKEENESNRVALNRAHNICDIEITKFSRKMELDIINKRNSIVHRGLDVVITNEDQNFIKILVEDLFFFYMNNKEEFSYKDFLFVLNNISENKSNMQYKKREKERQIELLDKSIRMLEDV